MKLGELSASEDKLARISADIWIAYLNSPSGPTRSLSSPDLVKLAAAFLTSVYEKAGVTVATDGKTVIARN